MFDRDRRTEHAPQALAFFIEQDRPRRVVLTNLDGATAISFHTDLLGRSDFAMRPFCRQLVIRLEIATGESPTLDFI
jgi:hypothetical protein